MQNNNTNEDNDDVVFEAEQESVSSFKNSSEDSQVQKLKKKLKDAEQKSKEHLDGWQRLKADVANGKQAESARIQRAKERGAEAVLENILPALDSFDSAMQGDAWDSIDQAWRQGMEFVHSQLIAALESSGVVVFGSIGDTFDTVGYEAAERVEVASQEDDGKVQKVLRRGYKNSKSIIRPARVIVGEVINNK